jgi:hypothetical protein
MYKVRSAHINLLVIFHDTPLKFTRLCYYEPTKSLYNARTLPRKYSYSMFHSLGGITRVEQGITRVCGVVEGTSYTYTDGFFFP